MLSPLLVLCISMGCCKTCLEGLGGGSRVWEGAHAAGEASPPPPKAVRAHCSWQRRAQLAAGQELIKERPHSALFPQEEKAACVENSTFTRVLHGILAPSAQTYVAGAACRFSFPGDSMGTCTASSVTLGSLFCTLKGGHKAPRTAALNRGQGQSGLFQVGVLK